jgi:putative tributyrin esterase
MAFLDYHYFSSALQKQTAAHVLLPEVGTPPYPTLYLLHGYSDDHTIWLRHTSIERYVADLPLIVVMPDSGHGFYSDAAEGYAYGTAIGTELIERIEKTLPARAERSARALAGLSMGGYGAFALALRHPDKFCAAHSLSGALSWGHTEEYRTGPYSDQMRRILGKDHVGSDKDLFALVENVQKAGNLPALRFDCGVDDFLIQHNHDFKAHLDTLKIPHEYAEFPGAHNWDYWDEHIQEGLEFVSKALGIKPQ